MKFKSGFVAIIGRPNVGKSTLLNDLIGEKISIISDKPQTTRNQIKCIYTDENMQVVFVDTPGIQKPKNALGEYMEDQTMDSLRDIDVIVFIVDHSTEIGKWDQYILEQIKNLKTKKIMIVNKIDLIDNEQLIKIVEKYNDMKIFDQIIPMSASNGENTKALLKVLYSELKEGPMYYPDDMITDQTERVIVGEIIREKSLRYLDQEVPHGIAVEIIQFKDRPGKDMIDVDAVIYCEKESHKGIIIGKNGRKLKGIGKSAREEIEKFMGCKVNLQIWVKVNKNWREKTHLVQRMGYK